MQMLCKKANCGSHVSTIPPAQLARIYKQDKTRPLNSSTIWMRRESCLVGKADVLSFTGVYILRRRGSRFTVSLSFVVGCLSTHGNGVHSPSWA